MQGQMIGNITVRRIMEYEGPFLTPSDVFTEATAEAMAPHRAHLAPRFYDLAAERLVSSAQGFLVKTPHHTVIVDAKVVCP